jgi:raffinose synthase
MSCGNDILYQTMNSTLTRTSTDFWPTRPETHGLHLYTNAQVCLWFGEFVHADWDMFQSGHEWGAFHAAGRAVSGSPVYVSDKPGQHNFELLRKLMRSDGTVLRCPEPGRPTRDCLFADPTKEDVLLKIWNRNRNNAVTSTAVIGVFNCRYHAEPAERKPVKGSVGPADIPGLAAGDYAVYFHRSGRLEKVAATGRIEVELPEGGWEAVTITAVENGFAAVGLANKLNAAAALHNYRGREEGSRLRASAQTAEGGDFVAYCARKPHAVRAFADGIELKDVPFEWKDGLLRADTRIGPGWVHVFVMGEED